jgi:hypothetical protein
MDTIPAEQIDALIKAEADAWLKDKVVNNDYYSNSRSYTQKSGLSVVVTQELEKWAKERIAAILNSAEWGVSWGEPVIGSRMANLLKDRMGEMLESLIMRLFTEGMLRMKNG